MNSNMNHSNRNKYYSDDEYKFPKDPIEIYTDNEGYESNNSKPIQDNRSFTHKSQKINNQQQSTKLQNPQQTQKIISLAAKSAAMDTRSPSAPKTKDSILTSEQMRNKIKEQAHRLQNLETYKELCERRLKQLVPNHPIPVTAGDLANNFKVYGQDANKNLSEKSYLQLIENKENEINELHRKIEMLENRQKNSGGFSSTNYNNTNNVNKSSNNNNNLLPPSYLDKLPVEKIKENYQKLFAQLKETQTDREQILDLLRTETLNNEEQRNYIEILKQTIESAILKQGLAPLIQQQKANYYNLHNNNLNNRSNENNISNLNPNNNNNLSNINYNNISNLDVLIDICKLKGEAEKHRKELVLAQVLITELKQEIEFLNKANEDMNIKKERIKENLESGLFELEDAKENLRRLEGEKDELTGFYENLLQTHEKLREELSNSNALLGKYEKELHENAKRISDLQTENENNQIIQSKMLEYKKSFEKIYEDFETNVKEKNMLEAELIELKEDLEAKQMELNRLKIQLEEKELRFENEKKLIVGEAENISKTSKKIERSNTDLENTVKEKEREVIKYQDKFNDCERALKDYCEKYDNLELDFADFKKASEKKIDANDKQIRDFHAETNTLKDKVESVSRDKENLLSELLELKSQFDAIMRECRELEGELDVKGANLSKLNEEYEKLFRDYTELEGERKSLKIDRDMLHKEIRILKDKYEKDLFAKNTENTGLNAEVNALKNELLDNKEKMANMIDNIDFANAQIDDLSLKLRRSENEIKILQEKEEELKKKSEQLQNLNRKYDSLTREKEEILRELNIKNGKLDDNLKKKNLLEDEVQGREKEKHQILDDLKKVEKELQMANELNQSYTNKLDKLTSDFQKETKVNFELSQQNKLISDKAEELANALEITLEDKELLHKESKTVLEEIQASKKAEKETQSKLNSLKQELQEIRVLAYSTQAIAKTYINKFYPAAKDQINNNPSNTNSLLTKQFTESIKEYFDFINNNNNTNFSSNSNNHNLINNFNSANLFKDKEKTFTPILKFLEDYTRSVSSEMEIAYEKLKNLSEENKDFLAKIKTLELNMHNMALANEDKNTQERKQNQALFELKEENKSLSEDIQALEQQCEKLVSDYKQVRNELKKKLEEIGDLKHELREANNSNLKLNGALKEKESNVSFLSFQIAALEDRIVIISKEKKSLENLVDKVSKSHPAKEMQKIVNEMLTVYDGISQLEREKAKLEQSVKNLELQNFNSANNNNKGNNTVSDNNNNDRGGANNEFVSMQVKIEKENLRGVIEELNGKINEKKELQRKLENDMRNLELNEKRNYELIHDYDYKIMQLTKELNETREELSNTKGLNKNASTMQRDYRSANNLSKLEDFNPRTADNSNLNINNNNNNTNNNLSNTNFDYNSRTNNYNSYNNFGGGNSNRVDRMDSFPSQDYGNNNVNNTNNKTYNNNVNNYNSNVNDYQYVPSTGFENKNYRGNNTSNIIRKYKNTGSYFD